MDPAGIKMHAQRLACLRQLVDRHAHFVDSTVRRSCPSSSSRTLTSPTPALASAPVTKGKTNIGCIFTGKKDGKEKTYYIYNVCDHQECYKEVGSQAISYTTGVPAMCGALMLLTGKWTTKGVHTVEEFDPDPYLDALDKYGLPRSESHAPALVD